MRMARRPRYYCDHCKKGSGSPSYMIRHERGCTANPKRWCGYCEASTDTESLKGILLGPGNTTEDWQRKMLEVRAKVENCPACILAGIRQSGVQRNDHDLVTGPFDDHLIFDGAMLGFDWKSESRQWKEAHLPEPEYPGY